MRSIFKCLPTICRQRCGIFLYLSFILLFGFCMHAAAANSEKVVDDAGLLTQEEEIQLQDRLVEIAEEFQCDVVVVTVQSLNGMSVQDYTDSYYYQHGYGYGSNIDGIILLVSMRERQFHLGTRGKAIRIFTDYGLEVIDDKITPYLSDGEYAKAFQEFADLAEEFMQEAANGRAYDTNHTYRQPMNAGLRVLIAIGIGLLAAAIAMVILFQQLRSVRVRQEAREYVRNGSFHITRANDLFLYRTVARHKIERSSGGGGGGGSTTHSAPGGRAGGRSGSF